MACARRPTLGWCFRDRNFPAGREVDGVVGQAQNPLFDQHLDAHARVFEPAGDGIEEFGASLVGGREVLGDVRQLVGEDRQHDDEDEDQGRDEVADAGQVAVASVAGLRRRP